MANIGGHGGGLLFPNTPPGDGYTRGTSPGACRKRERNGAADDLLGDYENKKVLLDHLSMLSLHSNRPFSTDGSRLVGTGCADPTAGLLGCANGTSSTIEVGSEEVLDSYSRNAAAIEEEEKQEDAELVAVHAQPQALQVVSCAQEQQVPRRQQNREEGDVRYPVLLSGPGTKHKFAHNTDMLIEEIIRKNRKTALADPKRLGHSGSAALAVPPSGPGPTTDHALTNWASRHCGKIDSLASGGVDASDLWNIDTTHTFELENAEVSRITAARPILLNGGSPSKERETHNSWKMLMLPDHSPAAPGAHARFIATQGLAYRASIPADAADVEASQELDAVQDEEDSPFPPRTHFANTITHRDWGIEELVDTCQTRSAESIGIPPPAPTEIGYSGAALCGSIDTDDASPRYGEDASQEDGGPIYTYQDEADQGSIDWGGFS